MDIWMVGVDSGESYNADRCLDKQLIQAECVSWCLRAGQEETKGEGGQVHALCRFSGRPSVDAAAQ